MIVWLASYPRSGITLFRILLHRMYGLRNYSVYHRGLSRKQLKQLPIARMVGAAPMEQTLEAMVNRPEIHIVMTHELPQQDSYPTIYLVRDGRDVMVSYAHFITSYGERPQPQSSLPDQSIEDADDNDYSERKTDPVENVSSLLQILHDLIAYEESFGGWRSHVSAWTQRDGPNILVKFEDLVRNPVEVVRQSITALGIQTKELNTDNLPSFEELHREIPQFFRKGRIGSWREEMPDDLHKLFWEKNGSLMESLCYQR